MKHTVIFLFSLAGSLFAPGPLAVTSIQQISVDSYQSAITPYSITPYSITLAAGEHEMTPEPESGSLLLPIAREESDQEKKKKCMTVCSRWGEECMFINRGAGGTSKKCRRACKSFAEECF